MADKSLQTTQLPEMVRAYKLKEDEMMSALANRVPKELFSSVVLTMFRKTPRLLECTKDSVLPALYEIASMGLVPGLGQAYLLPFKNNKRGRYEATLVVGYQGYVELAYRAGKISISAHVVREGDYFEWEEGLNPILIHRVHSELGDPLLAAYAVARSPNGQTWHLVMEASEVRAIRERSKAKDSGPWKTDEEEMWKKTPVRRLFKMLPKSPDMARIQEVDDVESMDADFEVLNEPDNEPVSQEQDDLADELEQDKTPTSRVEAPRKVVPRKVKQKPTTKASPSADSAPAETSPPASSEEGGAGLDSVAPVRDIVREEQVNMLIATCDDFGIGYNRLDELAQAEFGVEDVEHLWLDDLDSFKNKLLTIGELQD